MNRNPLSFPQVALDFMNRDHEEFAALLDELQRHTVRHFADEEKAMQESGFPVYAVHKGEHDAVLADMAARIEHWHGGRDIAALHDWLDAAVGEWFVSHVGSMDTVTAGFIAAQRQRS